MSVLEPKKLYPTVLIISALTVCGVILIFAGMPMAGTGSALFSAFAALVIAVLVALAYTHKAKPGH